ncbi:hypothetical protein [Spongiactinospora sp. 9N601]|uniref:hypothetical protein n=1 Tax=Spongiactinospora sp. 9N601 TaxID=3375149 RepID=UPI0037B4F151
MAKAAEFSSACAVESSKEHERVHRAAHAGPATATRQRRQRPPLLGDVRRAHRPAVPENQAVRHFAGNSGSTPSASLRAWHMNAFSRSCARVLP